MSVTETGLVLKQVSPLVSVCAWCQKERGEKPQANQTHGICERHRLAMYAEAGIAPAKTFSKNAHQPQPAHS